jgi:hypothetical protein
MFGLCNHCRSSQKHYEILVDVFVYDLEVKNFNGNGKEKGGSVDSMQLETEHIEIEDDSLVAGWQSHDDPEPVEVGAWSGTDTDPPTG